MPISILNRRASTHDNWNEDNYYVYEGQDFIFGAVFDGCSSGNHSYWASKTLNLIFKNVQENIESFDDIMSQTEFFDDNANTFLISVAKQLNNVKTLLNLTDLDLLATIVFFIYNKDEQKLFVKFVGDGAVFYLAGEDDYKLPAEIKNDENNFPLYLGYYCNLPEQNVRNFISTRRSEIIENVTDFSICSDGIYSFRFLKYNELPEKNPTLFLTADDYLQHLTSALSRKFNILSKNGWVIEDDLTIIRYKK